MSALVSGSRPFVARAACLLSAALFLTFALVQPFANHIDLALVNAMTFAVLNARRVYLRGRHA